MEQARPDGTWGSSESSESSVAADVQDTLQDAASNLKDQARDAADDVKSKGAERLAGVSRAVHGAADELGREMPQTAGYIHSAAETLESATSALRERSVEDLATSFINFARRQPAAAFAGAVLAGFALSRFLLSSAERR
jgi:hypothetical protein